MDGQLLCCRNTYCAILCIKECLVDVDKHLRILATLSVMYENCHDMEFVTLYIKAETLSLEGLGKLFRKRNVHRLVSSGRCDASHGLSCNIDSMNKKHVFIRVKLRKAIPIKK